MRKSFSVRSSSLIAGLLAGLAATLPGGAAVLRVPNQYATIQAAVDAASSGDTIRIAAGVYEEQILIVSKNLTLSGAPGAVLKAKPGLLETLLPFDPTAAGVRPLLAVVFGDDVVVRGLTIDGGRLGDANPWFYSGVHFHESSGGMDHCTVRGFRGNPTLQSAAVCYGFVAANFADVGRPVQHVRVSENTFEDNENSIGVQGDWFAQPDVLLLTFVIQDNTIRGVGPTDLGTQLGIEILTGASGEVRRNLITDHNYSGPAFNFSIGSYAHDPFGNVFALQPVLYEGNTFRNNQAHLGAAASNGSQFINNSFQGSGGSAGPRPNGLGVSGDNLRIINNDFSDIPTGITLFGDDPDFGTALGIASNVRLIGNKFCHVATPIDIEPLVTGVTQHGNEVCHDDERHGGDRQKDRH